jgi:hypothetical protein
MKKIIFLVLFISLSNLAVAQTYRRQENNKTVFWVPDLTEDSFQVHQYSIATGEFQNFEKTLVFQNKKTLDAFLSDKKDIRLSKKSFTLPFSASPLWPVKNQWSMEYEKMYSAWIRDHIDLHFFTSRRMVADCADVAYSLRWIFARTHYLPMAITLAGSNITFTNFHFNTSWGSHSPEKNWDQDPAFLASLDYIRSNTYTGTITRDTAYIIPSPENIIPGMINHMPGHTQVIDKVEMNPTGHESPFTLIESTITSTPLKLMPLAYYHPDEMRQFHWAIVAGQKIKAISNPMTSQKDSNTDPDTLFELFGFNKIDIFRSSVQTFSDFLEKRVFLVERGFEGCQIFNCAKGTFRYDEFSTDSNDKRFVKTLQDFYKYFQEFGTEDFIYDILKESKFLSVENCHPKDFKFDCATFTVKNKTYNLEQMRVIFGSNKFSSDPRHSIEKRWEL